MAQSPLYEEMPPTSSAAVSLRPTEHYAIRCEFPAPANIEVDLDIESLLLIFPEPPVVVRYYCYGATYARNIHLPALTLF